MSTQESELRQIAEQRTELEKQLNELNVRERSVCGENIKRRADFDKMPPKEQAEHFKKGGKVVD